MEDIQNMLDTIRASVHGQSHRKFRPRFGTSDVTQECAVQLIQEFRKRAQQNEEPTITQKWLKLIGSGVAWKLRRKNSANCRSVTAEEQSDVNAMHSQAAPTPEGAAILKEMSASLIYAIGRLSQIERTVVDQHYNKQISLSAIAREMNYDKKRVQRIHSSALKKLQAELVEARKDN